MLITKQKKLFQLRRKGENLSRGRVYKSLAYFKSGNSRLIEEANDNYQVVEYDIVEVGTIELKDIDERLKRK